MPAIGKCELNLENKNGSHQVTFIVADTESPSLLGLQTCLTNMNNTTKLSSRSLTESENHAGLKLNKKKCIFRVTETTFLGHVISCNGIKPDPRKIEAILNMPLPSTKI